MNEATYLNLGNNNPGAPLPDPTNGPVGGAPAVPPADPNAMAPAPAPTDPNAMAPAPAPADPAMPLDQNTAPVGNDPMMGSQNNGFDMGIGVTPDEDPKKYIEGGAAKLASELRKYQEGQPKPDMELNKTAVNTIAAATKTGLQQNQQDELMTSYADTMRRGEGGENGNPSDNTADGDQTMGGDISTMGGDMPMDGAETQEPLQEAFDTLINELFQNLKKDNRNEEPQSDIEYPENRDSFTRKPFTPPIH